MRANWPNSGDYAYANFQGPNAFMCIVQREEEAKHFRIVMVVRTAEQGLAEAHWASEHFVRLTRLLREAFERWLARPGAGEMSVMNRSRWVLDR